MNRIVFATSLLVFVSFCAWTTLADADEIYSVIPQTLVHETDSSNELITGGLIVLIDGASNDGILEAEELIEVTVYNTLAGVIHAYDSFDFSNVNATFDGEYLQGSLRVQHTINGEGFVDWSSGAEIISISDLDRTEFAQLYPWEAPHRIAIRAVPEPAGVAIAVLFACDMLFWRRR